MRHSVSGGLLTRFPMARSGSAVRTARPVRLVNEDRCDAEICPAAAGWMYVQGSGKLSER
jgi:hypothetical protein